MKFKDVYPKLDFSFQRCGKPASDEHGPGKCDLRPGHAGECRKLYLVPVPQTADELRRAGMVFCGSGKKK